MRFGGEVPHYPVVLLAAIVVFNFFSEATSGGLGSLVARENLLRKVYFPRAAVPISVSLTAAANLGLGVVVVFLFALINGVTPSATWLLFLGSAASVVVLATAVSVLLAVLFVRYRDVQPIWEVMLQLLFWGTPIIYTIESRSGRPARADDDEPARGRDPAGAALALPLEHRERRPRDRGDRAPADPARDLPRDRSCWLVGRTGGRGPLAEDL